MAELSCFDYSFSRSGLCIQVVSIHNIVYQMNTLSEQEELEINSYGMLVYTIFIMKTGWMFEVY